MDLEALAMRRRAEFKESSSSKDSALEGESDLTFLTIAKLIVIEHSNHQLLSSHLHNFHTSTYSFNDRRQSSTFDVTQIKKWPESILSYVVTSFAKLHLFNSSIIIFVALFIKSLWKGALTGSLIFFIELFFCELFFGEFFCAFFFW